MKNIFSKIFFLFSFSFISSALLQAQEPDPAGLLKEMISAIKNINAMRFSMVQTERIKGSFRTQVDSVCMQIHPLKIFISAESPGKSYEVLWIEGKNNGDAWVHPGTFPYITLSLDPQGSNMRIGHHSIFEMNLNYLAGLITDALSRDLLNFKTLASYGGLYDVNGKLCFKVLLKYPSFNFNPYQVKEGEDLISIAKSHNISEYMIWERNKNLSNYKDVKPGDHILIPERYAKTIVLFIDRETKLPLIEMMYDDIGLFERYEFRNIQLVRDLPEVTFSLENPEYHF